MTLVSQLPGIVARHYIAQVDHRDPKQTQIAFRQLQQMGRWGVPSLIAAALERDSETEAIRDKSPPAATEASRWLGELHDKYQSVDYRAEVCFESLLHAWNRHLSEPSQRRLIRYFTDRCIWIRLSTLPPDVEYLHVYYEELRKTRHAGADDIWVKRRVTLLVNGEEVESQSPSGDGWDNDANAVSGSSDFERREWRSRDQLFALNIRALGRGKHTIVARVLLGPGDRHDDALTNEPPPWFEEILVGPAEIEIADGAGPIAKTDSILDEAMKGILDKRKLNVSQQDDGQLRVEFLPSGAQLPEALAGDFYLIVDNQRVNFFPAKYRSVIRSLSLRLGNRFRLGPGPHTMEMEYVPSLQAAVDMALDSYWSGRYQFQPVQFEIDDDGKLVKQESLAD